MLDEEFIKRILDKTDGHERRISSVESSLTQLASKIEYIAKELTDGRHAQQRTCDTMVKTRDEVISMLNIIQTNQHGMQIESTALKTSIESDRMYRAEGRNDTKWLTNLLMTLPSVILAIAAVFAALQLKGH